MKTRKVVSLSTHLENQLTSYIASAGASACTGRGLAAAVGAITLGTLSLAPALYAEIVYTPANKSVGKSYFGGGAFSSLQIDLNNDGVPDFVVSAYNYENFSEVVKRRHFLSARGSQSNQILDNANGLALADVPGQVIGSQNAVFRPSGVMAQCRSSSTFHTSGGLWVNATNRYLGVKFSISGETHYGWARFTAYPGHATLSGYAYETKPDKPIPAGVFESLATGENSEDGKPASLGMLARGARTRPRIKNTECF